MSDSGTQTQWLTKILQQLRSRDDVVSEILEDGRNSFKISYNGKSKKIFLPDVSSDFRTQKYQFSQLRKTLTELGIHEGQEFVGSKRSRRPMSQEMLAARAKKKKEFDAWQELWRMIRKAEKSLDVEYEIAQMMDYY